MYSLLTAQMGHLHFRLGYPTLHVLSSIYATVLVRVVILQSYVVYHVREKSTRSVEICLLDDYS